MKFDDVNNRHADMVARLAKPGAEIVASLTPHTAHLLHMAVGACGEAGELLDAIKKVAIYCKQADRTNVVEELGDLEFYMEGLRAAMGIAREETLEANMSKLGKRYNTGTYSNQHAQERADKLEDSTKLQQNQHICLLCGSLTHEVSSCPQRYNIER